MAVRNFWVEGTIDGRETGVQGGPRAKDGGMTVFIKQRDGGSITCPVKVECYVDPDGSLITDVYLNGVHIASHQTER